MKVLAFLTLLVVVATTSLLKEQVAQFQDFKLAYGKTYKNHVEETTRFAVFTENLRSIEQHNALYEQGLVSFRKAVNKFSDMTEQEFKSFLALHAKPSINGTRFVPARINVYASLDWRTKGYVTEVKDQGSCGSCWAFSITGSTEGAYFRKSGKLVSLSEQQLVDCSTSINVGCSGGYLDNTFPYVKQYGLESEKEYPYNERDSSCKYDQSKVVTKIESYVSISNDENALLEAVATVGPVSVALDASDLLFFSSGIYDDSECSSSSMYSNHAVLIVGYGSENGKNYWIVKNSWGSDWGEKGYFRILRGANKCGIAVDNVYPIIN